MNAIMECTGYLQERYDQYFDRLGDNYKWLYQQQEEFHQQYHSQVKHLKTQVEQLTMAYAFQPPCPPFSFRPPYHPPSS